MASYKTAKIEKALCSKGFVKTNTHHRMLRFKLDGKVLSNIKTRLSHGAKEYDDNLLGEMKKQLRFENKEQLMDFIECPLSQEIYIDILKRRKAI